MLCEQFSLIVVHEIDDLIVLSHNHHWQLSQNSQSLFVCHHKVIRLVGYSDVERNQNFPSCNLVDHFEEFSVEIALNMMRFGSQYFQRKFVVLVVFIRSAKNSNRLDWFRNISGFLKTFILIFPNTQFLIFYDTLQLFDSDCVFFKCSRFDTVINEIQFIDFIFELFQSEDDRSDQNSTTWIFSMM